MVIKKNMQNQNKFVGNSKSFTPLLQPNFCHCICVATFIIFTKRKVMGSKLQVTPTKLQVTPTKLQVTPTKLQVTPTKLQVARSKLTSLTAETNKFQLTNMLFITF